VSGVPPWQAVLLSITHAQKTQFYNFITRGVQKTEIQFEFRFKKKIEPI